MHRRPKSLPPVIAIIDTPIVPSDDGGLASARRMLFLAMSGMGHEDAFPPPRLSGRCRFVQETFPGFGAMGETRRDQTSARSQHVSSAS